MNNAIENRRKELQSRSFEAYAHRFFEKWQPEDPRGAAEFSAELFTLVRQIYQDASAEQHEIIAKLINLSAPLLKLPVFIKEGEGP